MLKSLGIDPSILAEEELIKEHDQAYQTNDSSQDIQNDLSRRERDPDWWRDPFAMFEESDAESAEDISSYSSSNDSSEDDAEVNSGEVATQHQDEQDQLNDSQEPLIIENLLPSNTENEDENEFRAESLPAEAQRRLAQHSILMKQPQGSISTQTTSPNFSAPAIPALLLVSKLRSIVPFVPSYIVTLFVSLAGTQYIVAHFKNQHNHDQRQQMMNDESDEYHQNESDTASFLSKIRKPFMMKKPITNDYFEQNEDDENTDYRSKKRNSRSFFQQTTDHDSKRKKNFNSSNQNAKIQRKEQKEDLQDERRMRFKSKKELMEQITFWKERTDKAEYENEQLIAQSERMSREVSMCISFMIHK